MTSELVITQKIRDAFNSSFNEAELLQFGRYLITVKIGRFIYTVRSMDSIPIFIKEGENFYTEDSSFPQSWRDEDNQLLKWIFYHYHDVRGQKLIDANKRVQRNTEFTEEEAVSFFMKIPKIMRRIEAEERRIEEITEMFRNIASQRRLKPRAK